MNLIEVIICYVKWAVITAWSYAADLFMLILGLLVSAINLALSVLPEMTLPEPNISESPLGLLNYIVDMGILLNTAAALIAMTLLWELVKWLMKYVQ